jgi:hypothetical protein
MLRRIRPISEQISTVAREVRHFGGGADLCIVRNFSDIEVLRSYDYAHASKMTPMNILLGFRIDVDVLRFLASIDCSLSFDKYS